MDGVSIASCSSLQGKVRQTNAYCLTSIVFADDVNYSTGLVDDNENDVKR